MKLNRTLLGVNIDHVATLRQARGTIYPQPYQAALIAEASGADNITMHLREDRRHIQDEDVRLVKNAITARLNLEMAISEEMVNFALEIKPSCCCLVPEKRQELTTEGGLDVFNNFSQVQAAVAKLEDAGIEVSIFIEACQQQIQAAFEAGARVIEIHTGSYADATLLALQQQEYNKIVTAAKFAADKGFVVNAGHGLHYHNVEAIAQIEEINELNIGHSIIARAVFVGIENAVAEMKQLVLGSK